MFRTAAPTTPDRTSTASCFGGNSALDGVPSTRGCDDILIDDLLEFAAIPAPTFAEQRRLDWLEQPLADADGSLVRDEVGNLIWSFGRRSPPVLLLRTLTRSSRSTSRWRSSGAAGGWRRRASATTPPPWRWRCTQWRPCSRAEWPKAGAVAFTVGEEGLGNLRGAHAACAAVAADVRHRVEGHGLDQVLVDAVGSVRAAYA